MEGSGSIRERHNMAAQPICWNVKRNCSASPAQLAAVFASIVGVSFLFGVAFAAQGLWLVLPFVGLELLAVAAAFFCYGRRAADFERVILAGSTLSVERAEGATTTRWQCPAAWARVEVEEAGAGGMRRVQVSIVARGERVEVGRHLPAERRTLLARELGAALRAVAAA
jgi:uncharacterized membrane protein